MQDDPADVAALHLSAVEQVQLINRAAYAAATRGGGNPWRSFRFALEDALASRLSEPRIQGELQRLGTMIQQDPLYSAQFGQGYDRGVLDGMLAALRAFGSSLVEGGRLLIAIQNPVSAALYAMDVYPRLKAASDYLERNRAILLAAAIDWTKTVATLLVSVPADVLDGFFALTGRAEEQGRYVGRLLGQAVTELYLFVLGLIPGLDEVVLGRTAQGIRTLATLAVDLARGARASGVEAVAAGPTALTVMAQLKGPGAAAFEEAGQLATSLAKTYRDAAELPYLAHGDLTARLATSNGLARNMEALVRASDNEPLRALWPTDWQEWLLESHHGVEARIFRDPTLTADVRGFFSFLDWKTTDDMLAVPLSRITHTRKPATAFRLLDDAIPFTPVTLNPNTGVTHLMEEYTSLSRQLVRDIGAAGRYRTVEELLDAYESIYRQHGLVNAKGDLLTGGLWQRMEPMFQSLRGRLIDYRKLVPRPPP